MALEIGRRDARRQALSGLIDYAGLFPPASLDLGSAVAEYREVRRGGEAWMVGRFICPAHRLVDLAGALMTTMSAGEAPWSLVVTAAPEDRRLVADFSAEMGRAASVEAVEVKLPAAATSESVAELLEGFGRLLYFEVPWDDSPAQRLAMLAEVRHRAGRALGAKVRCGGLTAAAFPPVAALAEFLAVCAGHGLPVKATAGLHHPVRHRDPHTGFTHHGFLNLLVAGVMAHEGGAVGALEAVLAEQDATRFTLSPAGLGWGDSFFSADRVTAARREFFVGYGSCSIAEPVADLAALGMLPS